jgi:hypothetical protein
MRLSNALSVATLMAALLVGTLSAQAAPPLAALQVGTSARYKVTTQSNTPNNGTQSETHTVIFRRVSPTSIRVRVDGASAGNLTVGSDGTVEMPANPPTALVPFAQIAILMRAAPTPLAADNTWTANLAVPVKDQTDNVGVVLKATQLEENALTVTGTGSNTFNLQVGNQSRPVDVTVNATMTYGANHTLTSATSTTSAIVHAGPNGRRRNHYGSSWTISPM